MRCEICGRVFVPKEPWHRKCVPCFLSGVRQEEIFRKKECAPNSELEDYDKDGVEIGDGFLRPWSTETTYEYGYPEIDEKESVLGCLDTLSNLEEKINKLVDKIKDLEIQTI